MKIRQQRPLLLILALLAFIAASWSLLLTTSAHPSLDQQARDVGTQLRCPVCQGESVADSTSSIAQQMRANIKEQLQAGKSEQQVIQFFVDHYGEQIVWNPPWQGMALLTWLVPIGLLVLGALLLLLLARDWQHNRQRPVTPVVPAEALPTESDQATYERYRAKFERELAAEDVLFTPRSTEAG